MTKLNFDIVHPSWHTVFHFALNQVDPTYLQNLENTHSWLPGPEMLFNAFQLPLTQTKSILFGESPYPRKQSANGYAFWDANVHSLWSSQGLSKAVNRATSLRNLIKTLLVAEGYLSAKDTSQAAIRQLDTRPFIQTAKDLFEGLQEKGVLLLNASLVLSERPVKEEAKAWLPFIKAILQGLAQLSPKVELILFGQIAKTILGLPEAKSFQYLCLEHPYNLSFIQNPKAQALLNAWAILHQKSAQAMTDSSTLA